MLLIIEKVAILKTAEIFANTPDYVLASVASIAHEVELAAGETLIREGEFGDSMYIVVEGKVLVSKEGTRITTLGPGNSVGELAILDPKPRAADVSAVEETLLFRIDKEPFEEVMADRPEIAQGVIRALAQRLREHGNQIVDLRQAAG